MRKCNYVILYICDIEESGTANYNQFVKQGTMKERKGSMRNKQFYRKKRHKKIYIRANVRDCLDPEKSIPVFTNYNEMIRQTRPDISIITTMDSSHHEYIVRSLDAGVDVICEKPMTIDAEKTRAILEAEKRNNRKIIVTFNCRFMPGRKRVKELLDGGAVGRVLSANFEWLLDQRHGADCFRRWHKFLKNSGGLLITKATHHFDFVA